MFPWSRNGPTENHDEAWERTDLAEYALKKRCLEAFLKRNQTHESCIGLLRSFFARPDHTCACAGL